MPTEESEDDIRRRLDLKEKRRLQQVRKRRRRRFLHNTLPHRATQAIGAAALAALVTAILWGSWNGGEHAEFWAIAIPGTLTEAGTLALADVTYAVLRDNRDERRQRDIEQRRAQASRIHVGVPQLRRSILSEDQLPGRSGIERFSTQITIYNKSEFPIDDVQIRMVLNERSGRLSAQGERQTFVEISQLLPGTDTVITHDTHWLSNETTLQAVNDAGPPEVFVVFTDRNGIQWSRDANYGLMEVGQ